MYIWMQKISVNLIFLIWCRQQQGNSLVSTYWEFDTLYTGLSGQLSRRMYLPSFHILKALHHTFLVEFLRAVSMSFRLIAIQWAIAQVTSWTCISSFILMTAVRWEEESKDTSGKSWSGQGEYRMSITAMSKTVHEGGIVQKHIL